MNAKDLKCVIIVDKEQQIGLIANTCAILGCSLGKFIDDIVGKDIPDKDHHIHKGIINTPLPILAQSKEEITALYRKIKENYNGEVGVIDFSDVAQKSNSYDYYTEKLSQTDFCDLTYLGICIYGDKKTVNRLTASIPTLK